MALVATGVGFLYFAWVFVSTGIVTAGRGRLAVSEAEDPDRFFYSVALVIGLGVASIIAALVTRR